MAAHLAYYEVLGLDAPPADRKAVKRAYSKKLKVTRPEDDPDGFMRLRDAHDLALNILARQTENAAMEAQQITVQTTYASEQPSEVADEVEPETTAEVDVNLTYADMLPAPELEPDPTPDTSYAIGATPNLDAPPTAYTQPPSEVPGLISTLDKMLADPHKYNNRESWNTLFRRARQLDIDDYVDFEQILLERVLRFHDYDLDHPLYDEPENMPNRFSPSITVSLFKTMSWDQVNKLGNYRAEQIEWLERRMSLRKRSTDSVPIPSAKPGQFVKHWTILIVVFFLIQFILMAAKS